MACIEARGLRKAYGKTLALDGVDLRVEEGRILGLIGPNGAGKTTALHAILGLIGHEGQQNVLGRNPWTERDQLMRDVCFIADVAVLPRWIRVSQALDYVAGVHPRFDRAKAEAFLAKTTIRPTSKVRELSKGMVTQLHLALVMAIDARLLVFDEPTLGLDLLYRKQFYDSLLGDYFDGCRTVVVATHQVEEVQHVLTDLMFIDRGRIVFDCSMEEFESRYLEVMVHPEHFATARELKPIHERQLFGRSILLFDRVDRHDESEVQLGHHTLRQFPNLAGTIDGGLCKKTFRLCTIESRMYASDIIERLRNPQPARQLGDIGNETHVAHELIALGPRVASEHPQFSLIGREAENCVQRGGLARAVGSDKSEDAALFNTQIDAVQRDGCAEDLAEAACFYQCHLFCSSPSSFDRAFDDGWPFAAASSSSFGARPSR